jgi:hypothetical protein
MQVCRWVPLDAGIYHRVISQTMWLLCKASVTGSEEHQRRAGQGPAVWLKPTVLLF